MKIVEIIIRHAEDVDVFVGFGEGISSEEDWSLDEENWGV